MSVFPTSTKGSPLYHVHVDSIDEIAGSNVRALSLTAAQIADGAITPGKLYNGEVVLADPLGLAAISQASPSGLTPTFSRAGAAYDPRKARSLPYRPWLESIITPSPPDTEELVSEEKSSGPPLTNVSVQCTTVVADKTYLIAFVGGIVYRKTRTLNSGKWTAMTTPASIDNLGYVWGLSNGDLMLYSAYHLYTEVEPWNTDAKLWRSTDAGDTWVEVLAMPYASQPGSDNWSLSEDQGGTVLFGEYGDWVNGQAKHLHRSADYGATWSTVLTVSTRTNPLHGLHFHGAACHRATGRWVAIQGDGDNRIIHVSDDDGISWVDARTIWSAFQIDGVAMPHGQSQFGPTFVVDTGHPTCFWHTDGAEQNGKLNVLTGELTATTPRALFVEPGDGRFAEPWDMRYIDGVLYHSHNWNYTPTGGVYYPAIVACPNPNDDEPQWVIVAQHSTTYRYTARIAGIYEGKLHWLGALLAGSAVFHGQRTVPTLTRHSAVMVAPAATNQLDSAIKSSFEGATTGWTVSNGTFAAVGAENGISPLHGSYMAKLTETTTSAYIRSPVVAAVTNDVLTFELWLRQPVQQGYTQFGFEKDSVFIDATLTQVMNRIGSWQQRRITHKATADGNYGILLNMQGDYAGQVCYFDCAAIWKNGIPIPWHPGGAARPADALSYAATLATSWTLLFQFNPDFASFQLKDLATGSDLYLLSIVNGASKMELYYDAGDAEKFNLYVDDGASPTTISTAAVDFHPRCPIWFAIRYDAGNEETELSFALGKKVFNVAVAELALPDLSGDVVATKHGDSAGANGMPGLLSNLKLYPALLTDDEISAEWGAA